MQFLFLNHILLNKLWFNVYADLFLDLRQ